MYIKQSVANKGKINIKIKKVGIYHVCSYYQFSTDQGRKG
jgi:hypothetical protein